MAAGIEPSSPAIAASEFLDAAPFGWPLAETDGKSFGARWAEPRKIRQLAIEFADGTALPPTERVRVEYWQRAWNGHADLPLGERNAGNAGWEWMDDWYNGTWKTAAAHIVVKQSAWVVTFDPTSDREFEQFTGPGVTYRQTMQIRLVADTPLPRPLRFRALTDARLQTLAVRVQFGTPLVQELHFGDAESGTVEVFNGTLVGLSGPGVTAPGDSVGHWSLSTPPRGELRADLLMAADPVDARYDRTIVTVRSAVRPFSFAADEVARGDRILIDDLGVLVTRADDPITLEECRARQREQNHKTVYARVFDEPEQTLARAWADMPLKHPLWFVHGLPGDRNTVRQYPDGSLLIAANPQWFKNPASPRDSERKRWSGDHLGLHFGFPAEFVPGSRALREGWLPVLRTWWQAGPLYYEQTTVLDTLTGDLTRIPLDEPTVLLMSVRIVNTSDTAIGTARLRCTSEGQDTPEKLKLAGDRVLADFDGQPRVRYLLDAGGRGDFVPDGDAISWSLALGPGATHELQFRIPTITLATDEELAALRGTNIAERTTRLCAFWRDLTTQGTQITTPEPWLTDFYKAHLGHLLINCLPELDSDRLHAHVGTWYYGVFPNESVMMISDLDRRGLHDLARRCYDSFVHYQGTVRFEGDYRTQDGLFYGAGGHEMGSYNKSHGYVLWGLAQHWFYTRDRAWMERVAPAMVKGCEWVMHERRRTMTDALALSGHTGLSEPATASRLGTAASDAPLDYGWLPKGALEDVTDYWNWLATNAATVWGFEAAAAALADFGHPRGPEMQTEARAYRADFLRGMQEARIRAPVVGLRDGTYVPKFPSRLYERGRSAGWIRETLEGAMFLPAYELLPADAPETRWILKDYEDNLYISDTYGYSIPAFESFWFSRGGFSMQANLLDGPLPYLYRDDIQHYLRAFFNGFASAFYPETRMCNEHCLPELGYPAGDHFKTSDEAQVTYWLRLMFVREHGREVYLGQAIPRCWLADGRTVSIARAATHFGPLSFTIESHTSGGEIHATLTPPERNRPDRIFVRLRHPDGRPLQGVTVNGREFRDFDVAREWLILPGDVTGVQQIIARY